MRVPHALTEAEVASFVGGCSHLRDRVLVTLLNEAGLRIGEALGAAARGHPHGRRRAGCPRRENANGARAKTWGRQGPVTAAWLRLHAEYLHREYGDLDSDYVFVGLWPSLSAGR